MSEFLKFIEQHHNTDIQITYNAKHRFYRFTFIYRQHYKIQYAITLESMIQDEDTAIKHMIKMYSEEEKKLSKWFEEDLERVKE